MNTKNICKIVVLSLLFFIACKSPSLPLRRTEAPPETDQYIHEVALNEMPELIVQEKSYEEEVEPEVGDIFGKSAQPGSSERRFVQGFRIQLFQTRDREEADSLVAHYQRELGMNIYRPYEAPFFKLKVGDFVNEEDARELLAEIIRKEGLEDAWIVRDRVLPE